MQIWNWQAAYRHLSTYASIRNLIKGEIKHQRVRLQYSLFQGHCEKLWLIKKLIFFIQFIYGHYFIVYYLYKLSQLCSKVVYTIITLK